MTRNAPRAITLLCLLGLAGVAQGQALNLNQPVAPRVAPDPRTFPSLRIDPTEHNFGTIFDNQEQRFRITFWNDGPGVLEIREWRGSCSCTVSELYRDGDDPARPAGARQPDGTLPVVTFQPGERGWVDITYDPRGKHGPQSQTVTFVTNHPTAPTTIFHMAAHVIPLVSIEPSVINFGSVVKGQGAELEVFVTGRTEDFTVEHATISGLDFASVEIMETVNLIKNEDGAWVPEPEEGQDEAGGDELDQAAAATRKAEGEDADAGAAELQPDAAAQPPRADGALPLIADPADSDTRLRRTRLVVRLAPDAPPGRFTGNLSIRHNDPRREGLSAIVMGEVVGDIGVMPRQVAFGLQQANVPFERKIQVLARGGNGFRITGIDQVSNLPDTHKFNIQWEPIAGGANQGYIVTIRGKFPPTLAQVQGEFRIHTTLESEAEVIVPFFGHVQGVR